MFTLAESKHITITRQENNNFIIKPGANFHELPPTIQPPSSLPQICNTCQLLVPLPHTDEPGACISCNIEDPSIKLSASRVCQSCQLVWLLKQNTLDCRMKSTLQAFRDSGLNEQQYRAHISLKSTGITDPTSIPPGQKNKPAIQKLLRHKSASNQRVTS